MLDSGELDQFEGQTQFPSGARTFLTTKFPLRDQDGRIYALCGVSTDITEQKRAEARLRVSQKLDALGQLAGFSEFFDPDRQ